MTKETILNIRERKICAALTKFFDLNDLGLKTFPDWIIKGVNLEGLELSIKNNPLGYIPEQFKDGGIATLLADNCEIDTLPSWVFSSVSKEISLSGNPLGDYFTRPVEGNFTKLTVSLENCGLIEIDLGRFKDCPAVDLSNNGNLTEAYGPCEMQDLRLNNCDLESLPGEILNSDKLKSFSATGNPRLETKRKLEWSSLDTIEGARHFIEQIQSF